MRARSSSEVQGICGFYGAGTPALHAKEWTYSRNRFSCLARPVNVVNGFRRISVSIVDEEEEALSLKS